MSSLTTLSLPLAFDSDANGPASWQIRRSRRARRLSARVHLDGRVEIVVPQLLSQASVGEFIARHRDWIVRRVAESARPVAERFPPRAFALSGFAETWQLHLSAGCGAVRLRQQAEGLLVLQGQGEHGKTRSCLRRWLIEHVRGRYRTRLQALAERHGFAFTALQVRRQRTRWGSCSSRGVISLNVAAAFQRPAVLDYLMLHELAHTRHMNHSRAYWRTVASCCPEWRSLDRELNQGWLRVPAWVFAE